MNERYKSCKVGEVFIMDSDHESHELYSEKGLVELLMTDGMSEEEASEFISYNLLHGNVALLKDLDD